MLAVMAPTLPASAVTALAREQMNAAVDVLADAFADYPVMRYTLGEQHGRPGRLALLIGLFVVRRFLRGDPVLGSSDANARLIGVATLTRPGDHSTASEIEQHRTRIWGELGDGARARYEAYVAAANRHSPPAHDYHLNMIGVRAAMQGRGHARMLLDAVHALADADPQASGVSLNTERASNLRFYERFGYRVLGHTPVGEGLETWPLFRASCKS
jgi:ribosomal protein S18 acetylase RimI-like enzyme